MIEACFVEIEPLIGTRAACSAVGRSRATHYRRKRPNARVTSKKPRPEPKNEDPQFKWTPDRLTSGSAERMSTTGDHET